MIRRSVNGSEHTRSAATMQAPVCLYGTSASTKSGWRRIARTAWRRNADWTSVLASEDHISFGGTEDLIVSNDSRPRVNYRTPTWQFNWIAELQPAGIDTLRQDLERHKAWVIGGMKHLWFCAGMVSLNVAYFPFLDAVIEDPREVATGDSVSATLHPLLDAYLQHIDALAELSGRLAWAVDENGSMRFPTCDWARQSILWLTVACGLTEPEILASASSYPSRQIKRLLRDFGVECPMPKGA